MLPGGLILQWDSLILDNGYPATFKIPFPNNVVSLQCTDQGGNASVGYTALTLSGFTVVANVTVIGFSYFAVGY